MTDKLTVTLEGKEFQVTVPLTLGQIQDCRVAVVLPQGEDPQEEVKREFKRSSDILIAALSLENPEINADKLRSMRISREEFTLAVNDVLDATGLVPKPKDGAGAQGEAAAETVAQ
jgi:hypothetical protein